jgi:hypothetical protein
MTRSRIRATGRREGGSYYSLPHAVMQSANYLALSAHAVKLLNDFGLQYRGSNNGDLAAAWKIMQPRGWRSRDTLCRALAELLHYGLIEKTRQGGLNHCSMYALTWCAIDECNGKLDVSATAVASGRWKTAQPRMPKPTRKNAMPNTVAVSDRHGMRVKPTR